MKTDEGPPTGVEEGVRFSLRTLRLSAAIRRATELHPKQVDLGRFERDPQYRLATMIYGKDHVKLIDIPEKVLAEVVMRAVGQVRYKCEQMKAPKNTLDKSLLRGFSQDSQLELPKGVSREEIGVYVSFYPRESNPVVPEKTVSGLEEYADAMVVIADAGTYMWLPVGNRLVEVTPELLTSIFEKDRFVGWYLLWGIKTFVESLVNEANRQLWLVTPLQDEIKNILGHISVR